MKEQQHKVTGPDDGLRNARRRKLIKTTAALGVVSGMMAYVPFRSVFAAADTATAPAASAATTAAFQKLSQFLTSRPLDAVLAQRYYAALKKRNPALDQSVAALNALVDKSKLAHVDDYLTLPDVDKDLDTCAKTIVKSLYLGVVGDDENAELIAYKEALMYKPTEDVLVVPTYGRGAEAWGSKPIEKKV
jgi:hypothetical protein